MTVSPRGDTVWTRGVSRDSGETALRPKALVHHPYPNTISGCERITLHAVKTLAERYDVCLTTTQKVDLSYLGGMFGIPLEHVVTEDVGLGHERVLELGRDVEVFFNNAATWVPPVGKFSMLYIHFPLAGNRRKVSLFGLKIPTPFQDPNHFAHRYGVITVNSAFTRGWLKRRWGQPSEVLFPPIDVPTTERPKQKIILSISRFEPVKKQDILVDCFRKVCGKGVKDYTLVLAGFAYDQAFMDKLKKMAEGLPVRFVFSPNDEAVRTLYAEAAIFWHMRGLEEPRVPDMLEHFGMVVVEAMQNGAATIAYDGGGHRETINRPGENGFLAGTREEIVETTLKLVRDDALRDRVGKAARLRAADFSGERFRDRMWEIIDEHAAR